MAKTDLPTEIRRLWPADMAAFRDHLMRLDLRSRHERFGGGVSDEFVTAYAEGCFGQGDLVFGAFIDGTMRGAGELRSRDAIWSERPPFRRHVHAEAAFSVEEGYRQRGVGARLFQRIEAAASNHGVETIDIVLTPDNVGMMQLAAKFKTQFAFEENQIAGRLTARRPTPLSLIGEASRDFADFTSSLFEAHLRAIERGLVTEV